MSKYRLIVISAPSGAGKTTLCQRLLGDFPQLRLSISTTTRKPRGTEVNGKEYFFVSREEFRQRIDRNEFAEWAEVHGNFYGTSKKILSETLKQGFSVLLDIDVQGAASLRKSFPKDCLTVFIAPPSMSVLENRLRSRKTESEETIQKRLKNAAVEMQALPLFDIVVINDQLEAAYAELKAAVSDKIA